MGGGNVAAEEEGREGATDWAAGGRHGCPFGGHAGAARERSASWRRAAAPPPLTRLGRSAACWLLPPAAADLEGAARPQRTSPLPPSLPPSHRPPHPHTPLPSAMYIPNFQSVLASALALTALGGKHKDSSNVAKGEVLDFCSPSPSLSRWRASLSWPALGERKRADFAPSPAAIDKECLDGDGSVPPSLPRHTPCSSPACLPAADHRTPTDRGCISTARRRD